jgi:hypothetical protein
MKNKIIFIPVILLSVLFFIVSCKKDNLNNFKQNTNDNTYSQNVIKRIENFRQQIQGNLKTGTMMTLDTAIWNLEALITNYGGYPDSASNKFILLHSHFTLPTDAGGLVSMDDVQALYQQMVDSITVQLNGIAGNVKFLKFSDVQQDSVVGNTAYLTSNNGYGQGFILGLYPPFTDDWIWGTLGNPDNPPYSGNCSGTDFSSDGSNEIQYRLNHPAAVSNAAGYTDLVTNTTDGSHCYDANSNPRIYWDGNGNINRCLEIEELNYFLIEADNIIKTEDNINTTNVEGLKEPGKSFKSIFITDEMFTPVENYPIFFHLYHATYGIPYFDID